MNLEGGIITPGIPSLPHPKPAEQIKYGDDDNNDENYPESDKKIIYEPPALLIKKVMLQVFCLEQK